jgi:hypothetical protein
MLRQLLWVCLTVFVNSLLYSIQPFTKQEILPTGFGYFENLYFDNPSRTFLAFGDHTLDVRKAIYSYERRGYTCENIKYPRSSFSKGVLKDPLFFVPGTTIIIFERQRTPNHFYHFFHCLEHMVGIWCFGGEKFRDEVNLFLIAGNGDLSLKKATEENNISTHLIKAFFPNAEIKLWKDFINESRDKLLCFERVLSSDRCMEHTKQEPYKTDRMLGGYFQQLTKEKLDSLALAVQTYAEVEQAQIEKMVVTYIVRGTTKRNLSSICEKELLDRIGRLPNVELKAVDFAKLSFKEQVNIAANSDVLLGLHGNGLSHILFLPTNATVIEIFPKDTFRAEYRILAKARGFNYFGLIEGRGLITDEIVEKYGVFGKTVDISVNSVDVDKVIMLLQNCPHSGKL